MVTYHRITIIRSRRPHMHDVNDALQWLGQSLGLFNLRDKNKSCFRVFIELLKMSKQNQTMSSDDIAEKLNLSRGTVMHHMNKLIESGIVVEDGNRYILRVDNLELLIEELRKDIDRSVSDLKQTAKEIDKWLGM